MDSSVSKDRNTVDEMIRRVEKTRDKKRKLNDGWIRMDGASPRGSMGYFDMDVQNNEEKEYQGNED
ncbi:MAG: hypothetical protein JW776_08625 [Candidatus Lokiarchaeota archaeon]|nr:hypothetical protein [Candidatus Lokiarchaeota archaeon]